MERVISSDGTTLAFDRLGEQARSREALVEALARAILAVSATDACAFFEHGGYRLPVHLLRNVL